MIEVTSRCAQLHSFNCLKLIECTARKVPYRVQIRSPKSAAPAVRLIRTRCFRTSTTVFPASRSRCQRLSPTPGDKTNTSTAPPSVGRLKFSVNLNRSPIHSLYPPVLPPTRDPILDECKSYWAQLCFATFPQTVRLAGLFPLEKLDIVAVRLFVVWPVLQAGREALVQWANVSAGWAILHAAIPNNAGYDVGVTAVMRTGAVGGAMVQVIALGLKLLEVATHARRGILPKDKPTAPELNRTILVRHLVWASVVALVETAVASLAAVLGVSVLKYSGTETMDIEHAVLSATVGAPILYVPQAIWYLYLIYRAWREIVRQEHPVRDSEKE